MKIKIEIDTDNDAFEYDLDNEVAWILHTLARSIAPYALHLQEVTKYPLHDSNGNRVGFLAVEHQIAEV